MRVALFVSLSRAVPGDVANNVGGKGTHPTGWQSPGGGRDRPWQELGKHRRVHSSVEAVDHSAGRRVFGAAAPMPLMPLPLPNASEARTQNPGGGIDAHWVGFDLRNFFATTPLSKDQDEALSSS